MSFLAPLFLLGAAAILGPIVFHLIRRTTREVTPFSTLMFLQPTPPRVTKRSRLENLWLLLLRCLAVALLALAFARPFFVQPASSLPLAEGAGKRTVILLDTSASLRREKLWDDARGKAEAVVQRAAPADEIAILAFDRTTRSVISFEEWRGMKFEERRAAANQRLGALSPGWAGTQLDAALLQAADLLDQAAKDGPHPREIVLISDLQEGSRIDALQGYEWPRGLEVVLDPVKATKLANASVQWLAEGEEAAPPDADAAPRLRVANAAESKKEQFQLALPGKDAAPLAAYVPPGQSRIVRPPKNTGEGLIRLSGDEVDFDNRLFVLPPQPVVLPLLFAGPDADEDARGSLYYLRRAFPQTRRQRVEITVHRVAEAVPAFLLQQAQLLVLADNAPESVVASARRYAEGGRTVLLALTSANGGPALAGLLGTAAVPLTEAKVRDYALLARIDFQHPIFAPFADPRFSDFTKIHFWKHRRLDPAALPTARVVAAFDSGDPALVEVPIGKGRALVLTSSWRPLDSQLALSSKFVPLLGAMLEQSSNVPGGKAQYFVGDDVPLPAPAEGVNLVVRKPDGKDVALTPTADKASAATPGSAIFKGADEPGIYGVTMTGTGTAPSGPGPRFVVNLAPEESRLTPLAPDRFTSLGVPLRKAAVTPRAADAKREAQAQAAELESRQKLWRWLLAGALFVLLLETLIAGRLSRAPAVPQEATS